MADRPSNRASTLRLDGGRRLTFVQTGPVDGWPVFYCHGAIGTPLRDSVNLHELTDRLGIRHIAINRPGFGGSDLVPGRRVLAFADDVRELADTLGVGRFSVVGVSAGGPYAMAVARELGERVLRVAVCSSLSPLCAPHRTPGMTRRIRLALSLLAAAPGASRACGDAALPVLRRHPGLLHAVIAAHAPAERERLAEPAERLAAGSSFRDATAYGVAGMIEDYLTYSRGWGFRPEEVTNEVHVWHGGNDPLVPVEHALQLAVALPRCRIFVDPDEGHHFFRRRLEEILTVLLRPDRRADDMWVSGAHQMLRLRRRRAA
jgi:pimeloyl-ACP methyl ester carboxylesterase